MQDDIKLNHRDIIEQYYKIYWTESSGGKVYGKSSEDLLELLAPYIIDLDPRIILDYGCGRSSLINFFWKDGERELYKFDPAVYEYNKKPDVMSDLLLCTDVLEHIPEDYFPYLFQDIVRLSKKQIFTVSLIAARKRLPNGVNAHITLKTKGQWYKILREYFNILKIIKENDKGIVLMTETKEKEVTECV